MALGPLSSTDCEEGGARLEEYSSAEQKKVIVVAKLRGEFLREITHRSSPSANSCFIAIQYANDHPTFCDLLSRE